MRFRKFKIGDWVIIDGKKTQLVAKFMGTSWKVYPRVHFKYYWPENEMEKAYC